MPSPTTVEARLVQWGVWSRLDVNVGPQPATCRSLESQYLPPQCWEAPEPRETLVADDEAMHVERCVLQTGVVLAAALRSHYVRRRPLRTSAEDDLLREAARRVAALLAVPERGMHAVERRVRHVAGIEATRTYRGVPQRHRGLGPL